MCIIIITTFNNLHINMIIFNYGEIDVKTQFIIWKYIKTVNSVRCNKN